MVIQTFSADHWLLHHVVDHDHEALVRRELIERQTYQYPPFVRMIRLTLKHGDAQRVEAGAGCWQHVCSNGLASRCWAQTPRRCRG